MVFQIQSASTAATPRPLWQGIGGVSLALLAGCLVGILSRIGDFSAFWPANGLLLGLLLRHAHLGKRPLTWVCMWLTYVLTDLVTGASWFVALSLNTANIVGVLCGWRFLYWQGIQQRGFQRQRAVLIMFCGSLLCAITSALVGMWPSHAAFDSPMWRVLLMWIATEFYNCVLILPVVLAAPRGWFWRWKNPFRFSSWKYVLPLGSLVLAEVFSIVFHGPGAIAFVIPSFLTGALARRALMEHGQKLLNRLQQDKRSVAVLMMDLDHFKQINDRFGHAQGDVVLQKFVELAHGALRPEDLLGRMGGEEFAMVLPGVDAQQAKAIGQRIGSLMREHAFVVEDGQVLHVSISIGVCAVSE